MHSNDIIDKCKLIMKSTQVATVLKSYKAIAEHSI